MLCPLVLILVQGTFSLRILNGSDCTTSLSGDDFNETELVQCDFINVQTQGPVLTGKSVLVLYECLFQNVYLSNIHGELILVKDGSIVSIIESSVVWISGPGNLFPLNLSAAVVTIRESSFSYIDTATVYVDASNFVLVNDSFTWISTFESIVKIAGGQGHFWVSGVLFGYCSLGHVIGFASDQGELVEFTNMTFTNLRNVVLGSNLIENPRGNSVVFHDCLFIDTSDGAVTPKTFFYTSCRFIATEEGRTALGFGGSAVSLVDCTFENLFAAVTSGYGIGVYSGVTNMKICRCNFTKCVNPVQAEAKNISVVNSLFAEVRGCAIYNFYQQQVVLEIVNSFFSFDVSVTPFGMILGNLVKLDLINSSFSNERPIWLTLSPGVGPTISGCCFSQPEGSLVVNQWYYSAPFSVGNSNTFNGNCNVQFNFSETVDTCHSSDFIYFPDPLPTNLPVPPTLAPLYSPRSRPPTSFAIPPTASEVPWYPTFVPWPTYNPYFPTWWWPSGSQGSSSAGVSVSSQPPTEIPFETSSVSLTPSTSPVETSSVSLTPSTSPVETSSVSLTPSVSPVETSSVSLTPSASPVETSSASLVPSASPVETPSASLAASATALPTATKSTTPHESLTLDRAAFDLPPSGPGRGRNSALSDTAQGVIVGGSILGVVIAALVVAYILKRKMQPSAGPTLVEYSWEEDQKTQEDLSLTGTRDPEQGRDSLVYTD